MEIDQKRIDALTPALEEFEALLVDQCEKISFTKSLINGLLRQMGKDPLYPDTNTHPDNTP